MKTVERKGLQAMAKEAGLDLYSLPYTDARPQRLEWLAQQPVNPPMVSLLQLWALQGSMLITKDVAVIWSASDFLLGTHAIWSRTSVILRLPSTLWQVCST